ncbi:hypothetical protein EV385_6753 [Krasilnikovia cinnamomea]|uniref:Uncharacterized protein n=1 Tax=Krasilnikovia cinnamomea TaxID=349313 RepID=A0A4V2G5Z2_9ACTN|nr:hypothetical protein [Krasilnikovia cinnamomea]RZU46676.1 hypothetical protein EV385_6753 [Krasilnikovia cinnamomea]
MDDDLHQVAAGLAHITQTETELRLLLDELLASRRALDRPLLERLDTFLHGPARQALAVFDELAAVDLAVLLAAMPQTRRRLAVA